MDLKLQDKTALVSASTAGIGYSVALLLAKESATDVIKRHIEARVCAR